MKSDVSNAISFVDETTLLYPAGANTVLYNTETKSQKFIQASDSCESITAICVSSNKRYVAVAERGPEKPSVIIYDLATVRKKKNLTTNDIDNKVIFF